MNLSHALRAALVTAAIAGAAALGTQVAQADGPAVTGTTAGVPAPQATPTPSGSTDTNPWD
ncbi:hypothetical protein ACFZBM_38385 [Streptomyces lavendulae]|uniref:Uncharacterized protein n=1 Tax=Streptomyces lavendulae subsp. lavendulae TaxID=58340 RepID=A0A2K8PAF2_STRLA|nr:hypothetical protein [Streptomyces lavendulae]GLX40562.1 hypothetical protein Sros01_66350 [Streptomyces roseochromogenus]ATZ23714.1 hypothetical protein SLAV_09225 [Streptomyces lavendulae subsp. lavendulae]QUQ53546.1 hypothetical protein SLLC_07255 [Streptomyces lavendulae subsp. lavendulae]GLV86885.1 hypothetical protein Slala03_65740 [Streptomyces lavendulae subsp. lavendulae]GLW02682.1 hypothetical protein Slala05_63120 [Streptomyces lavendulae subsp. lavendulae]